MKKLFVLSAVIISFFTLGGCLNNMLSSTKGEGPVQKETRSVSNFTGIDLQASGDVFIKQGDTYSVEVETHKNIAELLETSVEGNTLVIRFKPNSGSISYDKLKVYIQAPQFESLEISGSGNLESAGTLNGNGLAVTVSGSGNAQLKSVAYTSVEAAVSGSGNIEVGGTSDKSDLEVSGSGHVGSKGLQSKTVNVEVGGSGNVSCTATEAIDAHIGGSGYVVYGGNPPSVKSKVSGSGSISKE
jgi:hypothetical protein